MGLPSLFYLLHCKEFTGVEVPETNLLVVERPLLNSFLPLQNVALVYSVFSCRVVVNFDFKETVCGDFHV